MTEVLEFKLPNKQVFIKEVTQHGPFAEALAKHGMRSFNDASVTLSPQINSLTREIETGLSPIEQAHLESKLFLKPGALDPSLENPYWQEYYIKLKYGTEVLHLNVPSDYIKYKILLSSDKIAASEDDISPDSMFYIEDVVNTEEKLSTKAEVKLEAAELFSKFNAEDMVRLLKIYGLNPEGNTPKFVKGKLFEQLEANPAKFVTIASKSKEKIALEAFIFDLSNKGILRERAGVYFDGDVNKGSTAELVERFLDPRYQEEYDAYKERLEFNK